MSRLERLIGSNGPISVDATYIEKLTKAKPVQSEVEAFTKLISCLADKTTRGPAEQSVAKA